MTERHADHHADVAAGPAIALYRRLLVALDSSEHANRGLDLALAWAGLTTGATLTGIHVYAAQLHDARFRQMEGGLPEQFRQEAVLEEQRDVHDSLITRGLDLITQSYLDVGQRACAAAGIPYDRLAPEGKNYRELARASQGGDGHDLLVLGARGVGSVPGALIGSVCERVVRRTGIDTLVIQRTGVDGSSDAAPGPIVAAVDGSALSYGGMLTACELGRRLGRPVIVAAAYDPFYHYVVFNNITRVLSREGAEVFRFEDQEKLHEEIIDSGLARIYQAHLDVARSIADERGIVVETVLLAGKPAVALEKLAAERDASLLVVGKTGIHADAELDIGSVTENLLRQAPCDLLISLRGHTPEVDRIAAFTTSWSREAEKRMERVPSFARKMARMAILRYAQEKGHTVITERIVEEATAELMPSHAKGAMERIVRQAEADQRGKPLKLRWSDEAEALVSALNDHSLRAQLRLRAEKAARMARTDLVEAAHVAPFLPPPAGKAVAKNPPPETDAEPEWTPEAEARLQRVPEGFMRNATRKSILAFARDQGVRSISLEVAEGGIDRARRHMAAKMAREEGTPQASGAPEAVSPPPAAPGLTWTVAATALLERIPAGMSREMSRRAVETIAAGRGLREVDDALVSGALELFLKGSRAVTETLPWAEEARAKMARIPETVRGMLVQEIEGWAGREGVKRVDVRVVERVFAIWRKTGVFHLDPDDARNR